MKAAEFNNKNNFILGWYIPEEVCDIILNEQKGRKKIYYNDAFQSEVRGYQVIDLAKLSTNICNTYVQHLDEIKDKYFETYPMLNQVQKVEIFHHKGVPSINLQRYKPGNYYKSLHCENAGKDRNIKRILVFMTYLNTIEEGGGTFFPYQNFTCKPEKGLTLIWPAYFTHPHIGVSAPKEYKYIVTGWYNFITE